MKNSLLDLDNWIAPTTYELIDKYLKTKDECIKRDYFRWKNFKGELSPLALYKYLKARFGEPNGMSMIMKNPSADNLIHWHYTVKNNHFEINFWGHSSGLEIVIFTEGEAMSEPDRGNFVAALKEHFQKHGAAMGKVHADLERWSLFINPFVRLLQSIQIMLDELEKIDLTEPVLPADPDLAEASYFRDLRRRTKNTTRAASLGTAIRMLYPVMAESFVNLLIFVFRRSELKGDERLYEGQIRQAIDIRVKSLNIICDGFESPISRDDQRFKDFHNLMNGRNDFLHGNVDPTKLKVEEMYFDNRFIPLSKDDEGIIKRMISHYKIGVGLTEVKNDERVIEGFLEMILEKLSSENLSLIVRLMGDRFPGINEKTKRIGILLPDAFVEGMAYGRDDVEDDTDYQRFVSGTNEIELYYPSSWGFFPENGMMIFAPFDAKEDGQVYVSVRPIALIDMKTQTMRLKRFEKRKIGNEEWYILPVGEWGAMTHRAYSTIINNRLVNVTCSYFSEKERMGFSDRDIESIVGSVKIIPAGMVRSVESNYRFGLFLRGIAAVELLLDKARKARSYLEISDLLRCEVHSLLRMAIVFKLQIDANVDFVEDSWIYGDSAPKVKKLGEVTEEAERLGLVPSKFGEDVHALWEAGDFMTSNFSIGPVVMPDLEYYTETLDKIRKQLFSLVYELESELVQKGLKPNKLIVSREGFVRENLPSEKSRFIRKQYLHEPEEAENVTPEEIPEEVPEAPEE